MAPPRGDRAARGGRAADHDGQPPLDFLVVYTPPGRPFFCAEPVSHITDAFNLVAAGRTDTGARSLAAGETLRAKVTLSVER
jgi:aldose 1-epimerase